MKPGLTARPSASIVFVAGLESLPISAILPSLTPTSARKLGIPEPSTTRPFLIKRSYAIASSHARRRRPRPALARTVARHRHAAARYRRMAWGAVMQIRGMSRQGDQRRGNGTAQQRLLCLPLGSGVEGFQELRLAPR